MENHAMVGENSVEKPPPSPGPDLEELKKPGRELARAFFTGQQQQLARWASSARVTHFISLSELWKTKIHAGGKTMLAAQPKLFQVQCVIYSLCVSFFLPWILGWTKNCLRRKSRQGRQAWVACIFKTNQKCFQNPIGFVSLCRLEHVSFSHKGTVFKKILKKFSLYCYQ